ncbi:MAG: hypothetical protein LIO99_02215 [Clostridiales bacterium]|nr:hypothetical protein [Clostridiales bacterium]
MPSSSSSVESVVKVTLKASNENSPEEALNVYTAIFSRGYARGDTQQELDQRVKSDEADFKLIRDGGYIDYLVEGDYPVEIVAQWVLNAYRAAEG